MGAPGLDSGLLEAPGLDSAPPGRSWAGFWSPRGPGLNSGLLGLPGSSKAGLVGPPGLDSAFWAPLGWILAFWSLLGWVLVRMDSGLLVSRGWFPHFWNLPRFRSGAFGRMREFATYTLKNIFTNSRSPRCGPDIILYKKLYLEATATAADPYWNEVNIDYRCARLCVFACVRACMRACVRVLVLAPEAQVSIF